MRKQSVQSDNGETLLIRVRPFVGAMLTMIIVGLATLWIDHYEREKSHQDARVMAVQHASILRARLEGALHSRLYLAVGLAAFVHSHPSTLTDFQSFAEGLMETRLNGVRSLQLAPKAVVTHVYPEQTNVGVKGHDLLADPLRRAAVQRAIDGRLFVLAGPFPLRQGGMGLVARLPLFEADDAGGTGFWGFATVVVDLDPILAEGGLAPSLDAAYTAALRGADGLGMHGGPVFGDQSIFAADAAILDITLPHGSWQLAVMPAQGWPTHGRSRWVMLAGGLLLALAAGVVTFMRLQAPLKLQREVVRTTAALRASEDHFRNVTEQASDAVITTDETGAVTSWNSAAAAIFGYAAQEAIGRDVATLVMAPRHELGAGDDPIPFRDWGEIRSGAMESVGMRKDGSAIPIELTLARWEAAGTINFTAIVREIGIRKAMEKELARMREHAFQAQKMEAVSRLASGAAHELNNILGSILANAESAEQSMGSDHPARKQLLEVLDGGWRAAAIVGKLQVFSADGVGDEGGDVVQPSAVFRRLLPQLRISLPARLVLETHVEATNWWVAMDHDRFCHMIWNLYLNSCRSMTANGGTLGIAISAVTNAGATLDASATTDDGAAHLVLGAIQPGRSILVTVTDTGCGMDGETLARAFEPFFTTCPVGDGNGLGLSVIHGLIQKQGGCIAVTSTPGKGTIVTIHLPVVDRMDPESPDEAS